MKNLIKSWFAGFLTAAIFAAAIVPARANGAVPIASATTQLASSASKVISTKKPLSAQELAKYQQRALASKTAATEKKAGAASNTTVLIIVGVVVVVGVVALASGGGGGGGGY